MLVEALVLGPLVDLGIRDLQLIFIFVRFRVNLLQSVFLEIGLHSVVKFVVADLRHFKSVFEDNYFIVGPCLCILLCFGLLGLVLFPTKYK